MAAEALTLAPTERSPAVAFDPGAGRLSITGESYPEDAAGFFGPILAHLQDWLDAEGPALTADLELVYFNSSSAKALMNLFQLFERAAAQGRQVTVNWRFAADDETMKEFGEDFSEDMVAVTFNLLAC